MGLASIVTGWLRATEGSASLLSIAGTRDPRRRPFTFESTMIRWGMRPGRWSRERPRRISRLWS